MGTEWGRTPVVFLLALTLAAAPNTACRNPDRQPSPTPRITPGGALAASVRTEPRSFNRFAARDSSTDLVSELTQATLVRINKVTRELEPWLADHWTVADNGRRYTLTLRRNVSFSDGHPLTADDVVFTFAAAYDERASTVLADALRPGGKPLVVTASDAYTVVIDFPDTFAPGLRLLDFLPIMPKHKLSAALAHGTFASAWGLSTPPTDVVGLGPFVIHEYVPGQRLVLDRNPHYWRMAKDGTPLPYLDRITIEIVPDLNAELLRLDAGQIDVLGGDIAPDSYAPLKRAAAAGRITLIDLGVTYQADSLWFNLKPGAFTGDPRAGWIQRDELRRAISMAVDRKRFADTVFLGAGEPVYGVETSANSRWYWSGLPKIEHDPSAAKKLLGSLGLVDRNGDGILEDGGARTARFTLITQKGRPKLERGASVIADELKKIGLMVDVVSLDGNAVIERITSGKYDAVYFAPQSTDTDPGLNQDFWMSSGSSHLWNFAEPSPATEWEGRIDGLMRKQVATLDEVERKRLYDEIQMIFADHVPVLYFAAPRFFVATSSRVLNATPAIYPLPVLWAADSLAVTH